MNFLRSQSPPRRQWRRLSRDTIGTQSEKSSWKARRDLAWNRPRDGIGKSKSSLLAFSKPPTRPTMMGLSSVSIRVHPWLNIFCRSGWVVVIRGKNRFVRCGMDTDDKNRTRPSRVPIDPFQDDLAGLKERLQVGKADRPSAGYRIDELGIRNLHRVRNGQLDRPFEGFQIEGAKGKALRLHFRLPFVTPLDRQALRRVEFGDLPGVGDPPVREPHRPRGALFPIRFGDHAHPITLEDPRRCQRLP